MAEIIKGNIPEMLRKIYICLNAHRGGYIYNRELGSDIYSLVGDSGSELTARARADHEKIQDCEVCSAAENYVTVKLYGKEYRIELE